MFKNYKLMFSYMREIKQNLPEINKYFIDNKSKFSYQITEIKIDSIYRIYTVLNFPEKTTENFQKYGHVYADQETEKFIRELNAQLKKIGLFELVALTRADQIGENNILIVIEYKFLNIGKVFRKAIQWVLGMIAIILSFLYFF